MKSEVVVSPHKKYWRRRKLFHDPSSPGSIASRSPATGSVTQKVFSSSLIRITRSDFNANGTILPIRRVLYSTLVQFFEFDNKKV